MPFQKGRQKTGGRKAGVPYPLHYRTVSAKLALAAAFEQIGGIDALAAWGKQFPTEFYRLWAKLVPTELRTPGGDVLKVHSAAVTEIVVRTREEASAVLALEASRAAGDLE